MSESGDNKLDTPSPGVAATASTGSGHTLTIPEAVPSPPSTSRDSGPLNEVQLVMSEFDRPHTVSQQSIEIWDDARKVRKASADEIESAQSEDESSYVERSLEILFDLDAESHSNS
jgi:hypothetical protein